MLVVVKKPPANTADLKRSELDPWVRKITWRRTWQPIPVFLPGDWRLLWTNELSRLQVFRIVELDMTNAT